MWIHKLRTPANNAPWADASIDALLDELREGLQFTRAAQFAADESTRSRAIALAKSACRSVECNLVSSSHLLSQAEQERVMSGLQHLEDQLTMIRREHHLSM